MKIPFISEPKSEFMQHVITLMTGTTIAAIIPTISAPLLTRMFSPDSFGILALFMAISASAALIATGRYEIAIVLPSEDRAGANLTFLSFFITAVVSLVLVFVVLIFNKQITSLLKNGDMAIWLYAVPFLVLFTGTYQALYYWANRRKEYKQLAVSKIVKSLATVLITVALGLLGLDPGGLILGVVFGQGIAFFVLAVQVLKKDAELIDSASRSEMLAQARRYSNFPKYSLVADSINLASSQMPIILLSLFFGSTTVGLFSLTQRVMGAPILLMATSVCDVFKQRASSDYAKYGNCREIYLKTLKRLTLVSLPSFSAIAVTAPFLFAIIFGEEWRVAGTYARLLSFMFFLSFIVSPLSYVLYIAHKQKYDLIWQIALFLVTTLSICISNWLHNPTYGIALYSFSYGCMYLIYFAMSYKYACGGKRDRLVCETAGARC